MARELHDHFFRQAKREGYLSRAAYKLTEIDDKKRLLKPGAAVLDCGCAPGSWLQIASDRIGDRGAVVGVDLKSITHQFNRPNIHVIQGDLRDIDPAELRAPAGLDPASGRFDIILSDMAPNTTGDHTVDHHQSVRLCHVVLDLAATLLKTGGSTVMKVFEGEAYPDLMTRHRDLFTSVKGFKPKASRDVSTEMYIVATGYAPPAPNEQDAAPPPPPKRPSPGWG
jgi:23S rRNA (uridine2552-2'-O)-methyltransferase